MNASAEHVIWQWAKLLLHNSLVLSRHLIFFPLSIFLLHCLAHILFPDGINTLLLRVLQRWLEKSLLAATSAETARANKVLVWSARRGSSHCRGLPCSTLLPGAPWEVFSGSFRGRSSEEDSSRNLLGFLEDEVGQWCKWTEHFPRGDMIDRSSYLVERQVQKAEQGNA